MANNTTAGTLVKDEAKAPIRRVLTVYEREALKRQSDIFGVGQVTGENFSNGAQGATPTNVPWLRTNRVRLNEQQRQVMKVLEEGSPEPTSPEERDRLSRRSAAIREQWIPYFQTRKEIRAYSHRDPDFMSSLEKASEWSKPQKELGGRTPEELYNEDANICRRLDPMNPNAGNMEKVRAK